MHAVAVDDRGVLVRGHAGARLSMLLHGRRVWSFAVARDGRRLSETEFLIPWPRDLQPHLHGTADLVFLDVGTGERLTARASLGGGSGELTLTTERGKPLALDKHGRLQRTFDTIPAEHRVNVVEGILAAIGLLDDHGVEAFVTYGCLLGAVRDGRLIGHDDDADISYLAASQHPFEVIRESYALQRLFQAAGWRTVRMSGADFKVVIPQEVVGARQVAIDVFTSFRREHELLMMPNVRTELPDSALLPRGRVTLEGREVPAPADAPAVLEAAYGPGWRVPDPSFKPAWERTSRRRTTGWMRGERRNLGFWNQHWSRAPGRGPSGFAAWVADHAPAGSLVEVGCGRGEDAMLLASGGRPVLGLDYSPVALRAAGEAVAEAGVGTARFEHLNLYDTRQVLARGGRLAREGHAAVCARMLVDALTEDGRHNLWRLARSALRGSGGPLLLEFATRETRGVPGGRRRDVVPAAQVARELAAYGFIAGEPATVPWTGDDDDPRVQRLVARMEGVSPDVRTQER